MRHTALAGWVGMALLCACQGDIEDTADAATDLWVIGDSTVDATPVGDAPKVADVGPPADSGPAVDKGPVADAPGPCAAWSAWTCTTDPVYLCKATCSTGLQLSCVSSGQCVCGVSVAPCGPFTAASPCDACKQAVEQGCCD